MALSEENERDYPFPVQATNLTPQSANSMLK